MNENEPNQWAVMFHGVNYPGAEIEKQTENKKVKKKVLNWMMGGLKTGTMLQAGERQAGECEKAINKPPGTLVGKGIYGSPHF